jgi:hypothetical protein
MTLLHQRPFEDPESEVITNVKTIGHNETGAFSMLGYF